MSQLALKVVGSWTDSRVVEYALCPR